MKHGTHSYSRSHRMALADWLVANDINPNDVPLESSFHVEDQPDGSVIHYEVFVRENGNLILSNAYECKTEPRTTPLIVEPPDFWPV